MPHPLMPTPDQIAARKPRWLPTTDPTQLLGKSDDGTWTVRVVQIAPGVLHVWFTDRPVDLTKPRHDTGPQDDASRALYNPHPHLQIDARHAPESHVWIPLARHPQLAACLADALSTLRRYPWPSHDSAGV